jgi:Domain of unknown function (DUF4157)
MDLRQALPALLPAAIAWAEARAKRAAEAGITLTAAEQEIARRVGVSQPARVRVEIVDELPLPEEPVLRAAALAAGLSGPGMVGMTLGYSIFIRRRNRDRRQHIRLLSHELRHVHQYEQHGSIAAFLRVYLSQIVEDGYANAPLEADARAHEIDSPSS